jgi:hypothetical protein
MAEFVRFALEDGSEVFFESSEGDLVSLHGGEPTVVDGGRFHAHLEPIAKAASQLARSLRSHLSPDEIELEFGLKVAGEVNWWFFAKSQAQSAVKVTLVWNHTHDDKSAK